MRALRFHAAGDLRLEEVPEPGSLGEREVLIAPRFCGICGTDVHEYLAGPLATSAEPHPMTGARLPQILGHELAGEVLAVGAGVEAAAPGDRVAVMPLISCGRCFFCARGENELCEHLACTGYTSPWGGMGERAVVREDQLVPLPAELSYEQGALLEPAAVALTAIERGDVGPGDAVLVAGGGPIGALVLLAARLAGAEAVAVSEPNAARRAAANGLGADLAVDPQGESVAAAVAEMTAGRGADVAFECAGNQAALDGCLESVRRGGTVVQIGVNDSPTTVVPSLWTQRALTIRGAWAFPVHGWERIARLVAGGAMPVERTITASADLGAAGEAVAALADRGSEDLKVLVSLG